MARLAIAAYELSHLTLLSDSVAPLTALSTANGNIVANNGQLMLLVTNSSGSVATLTVEVPVTVDSNLTVSSRTYSVPANTTRGLVGIFPTHTYGPYLLIDTSSASLSAAAISLV